MFTILIADDEAFSRYALKTLITKNFSDLHICGEAQDGIEVCRMAKDLKPDLIMMDIKMPGKNGIEASEEILKENPGIYIIILSAYDYFNYAQKSLELGIYAYLLKPFKEKQIVDKINTICSKISTGIENSCSEDVFLSGELKRHLNSELINLLIAPWGREIQIEKIRVFLNLPESFSGFFICVDSEALSLKKREWAADIILKNFEGIWGETHDTRLCILVMMNKNNRSGGKSFSEIIKHIISDNLPTLVESGKYDIGLSSFSAASQLPTAYKQALYAKTRSTITGTVVAYSNELPESPENDLYPYDLEEELLKVMEWENFGKAWGLLEELCSLVLNSFKDTTVVAEKLISLFVLIKRTAQKTGNYSLLINNKYPLEAVTNSQENNKRVKLIMNFFNDIESEAASLKERKQVLKTSKAFQYIKQNLFDDISLEAAADYAGISPQYLSRKFKEKYNVNFIDYITEHRINHASYLLKTTDSSIKEISAIVGYSDPNYFSRVFKKMTNTSPNCCRAKRSDPNF